MSDEMLYELEVEGLIGRLLVREMKGGYEFRCGYPNMTWHLFWVQTDFGMTEELALALYRAYVSGLDAGHGRGRRELQMELRNMLGVT